VIDIIEQEVVKQIEHRKPEIAKLINLNDKKIVGVK
jgi:hypothetical protein